MKILLEKFPYRYVEKGELENGFPDYRIQKVDSYTGKYLDMYLLDNQMQLLTAWKIMIIHVGWIPQVFLVTVRIALRQINRLEYFLTYHGNEKNILFWCIYESV